MNESIASAMIRAAQRVEERLEAALADVGLSCAKFGALNVLVDQGKPISLSELAAKLTCVRSNITQLVDRLEADGLVKRTDDPADRRAVCAEVSALGRKRQAAGAKAVNAIYQAVARELSPMDPQALKRALNAVRWFFAHTCVESTVRFAAELGYEVTVVKDATADYADEFMRAALVTNLPNYSSAIVTADEVVDLIPSAKAARTTAQ